MGQVDSHPADSVTILKNNRPANSFETTFSINRQRPPVCSSIAAAVSNVSGGSVVGDATEAGGGRRAVKAFFEEEDEGWVDDDVPFTTRGSPRCSPSVLIPPLLLLELASLVPFDSHPSSPPSTFLRFTFAPSPLSGPALTSNAFVARSRLLPQLVRMLERDSVE